MKHKRHLFFSKPWMGNHIQQGQGLCKIEKVRFDSVGLQACDFRLRVQVVCTAYGSRSKTHARLLVSEWHLHIWMYVFAAVAKDRERAAKGSRKVWTPLFINIYVIVIVFMLGRFLAELPQDPCLGPYAASIQHFDRYLCRVMWTFACICRWIWTGFSFV